MSRIGKQAIPVPSGVTPTIGGGLVKVKGPKGELAFTLPEAIKVSQGDDGLKVELVEDTKVARSMWGMSRTRIANLVEGVTTGYTKVLEIQGIGYRAAMKGKQLSLTVGYSHDVMHPVPDGVKVEVSGAKQEIITITGIDKQVVGQLAAEIRAYRPPEPYQGKGIRYQGEYIFRKEGKKK